MCIVIMKTCVYVIDLVTQGNVLVLAQACDQKILQFLSVIYIGAFLIQLEKIFLF